MKYMVYFMLCCMVISCQKEELKIVEGQEEESFIQDSELANLLASVVSHDGSFDDVVDNSSCFSINFPYICRINGHLYPVNSADDLAPFGESDLLIPEFPIDITFANHLEATVPSYEVFKILIAQCANGELWNQHISCVDLMYPIYVAIYNPETSEFETISFTDDKQTFQTIQDFNENVIASINYPIEIKLDNKIVLTINSNDILKSEILDKVPFCE